MGDYLLIGIIGAVVGFILGERGNKDSIITAQNKYIAETAQLRQTIAELMKVISAMQEHVESLEKFKQFAEQQVLKN